MLQIHNGWTDPTKGIRIVCPGCLEAFYLKEPPTCEDGRFAVMYVFCSHQCYAVNHFKHRNVSAAPATGKGD